MSVARDKQKDARRRAKAKLYEREAARDAAIARTYADEEKEEEVSLEDPLEMVQPIPTASKEKVIVKEKILVKNPRKTQRKSALVSGEGRSMGMEVD